MRPLAIAVLIALVPCVASAEDSSRDRDDLDEAAGRALFQNSPLSVSIAEPPPAAPIVPVSVPENRTKRGIRIVYPGPYDR
jgi:hypothetical protein